MKNRYFVAITLMIASFFSVNAFAITGDEVLKKADAAMKAPKDMTADTKMVLIDSDGKEKVRHMKSWVKNFPDRDSWRLMKFASPADVRNVGFLILEEDMMYLYMPEFKKVRRIASHSKKDNFMGSDFFYDDLATSDWAKHYSATIVKEDDKSYTLELKIKDGSDKPYPSAKMTVDKESSLMIRVEFNDSSGATWKIMTLNPVKIGKFWTSDMMKMEDVKKKHKTDLEMSDIKLENGLEDDLFTERYLKRPVK